MQPLLLYPESAITNSQLPRFFVKLLPLIFKSPFSPGAHGPEAQKIPAEYTSHSQFIVKCSRISFMTVSSIRKGVGSRVGQSFPFTVANEFRTGISVNLEFQYI